MDESSSSSVKTLSFRANAFASFSEDPFTLRAKALSASSVEPAVSSWTPLGSLFGNDTKKRAAYLKDGLSWVINVEGYDTSLPEDDLKSALTNHFRSCGPIFRCRFVDDADGRRASIIITGDDADKKALELNGSEAGGGKLVVTAKPFPKVQGKKVPFGATVSQVHK